MSKIRPPRPPSGGRGAFGEHLRYGSGAELLTEIWARRRGHTSLPTAKLPPDAAGSPRFDTPHGRLIVPDIGLLRGGRVRSLEAKRRRAPTWHRRSGTLTTGFETRELDRYRAFARATHAPVLLAFLHDDGVAELLGGEAKWLAEGVHHPSAGMSFWALDNLDVFTASDKMAELRAEIGLLAFGA